MQKIPTFETFATKTSCISYGIHIVIAIGFNNTCPADSFFEKTSGKELVHMDEVFFNSIIMSAEHDRVIGTPHHYIFAKDFSLASIDSKASTSSTVVALGNSVNAVFKFA